MIPIGVDELRVLRLAVGGDLSAQLVKAAGSAFTEGRIQLQRGFSHSDQLVLLIQKRNLRVGIIGITLTPVIAAVHKQDQ